MLTYISRALFPQNVQSLIHQIRPPKNFIQHQPCCPYFEYHVPTQPQPALSFAQALERCLPPIHPPPVPPTAQSMGKPPFPLPSTPALSLHKATPPLPINHHCTKSATNKNTTTAPHKTQPTPLPPPPTPPLPTNKPSPPLAPQHTSPTPPLHTSNTATPLPSRVYAPTPMI